MNSLQLTHEDVEILAGLLNSVRKNCMAELEGKLPGVPAPTDKRRAEYLAACIQVSDKMMNGMLAGATPSSRLEQ